MKLQDLAINKSLFSIKGNEVTVRVFSQGAVGTPETKIILIDAKGKTVATSTVPALDAPLDLISKWSEIKLSAPYGTNLSKGCIQVDPDNKVEQVTRKNTTFRW
jgi:hypothetical protein